MRSNPSPIVCISISDYDAILTENGDITPKYLKTRELLQQYVYTNGKKCF